VVLGVAEGLELGVEVSVRDELGVDDSVGVRLPGVALGVTDSVALGVTDSVALGVTDSVALGVTDSVALGVTDSVALGVTDSVALGVTDSVAPGVVDGLGDRLGEKSGVVEGEGVELALAVEVGAAPVEVTTRMNMLEEFRQKQS